MARISEETIAGQVRGLAVGQSYSRTKRISLIEGNEIDLSKVLLNLRNSVNQVVGRTRNEFPDNIYRVESAAGICADGRAILATVAVTRLATDDDSDEDDTI